MQRSKLRQCGHQRVENTLCKDWVGEEGGSKEGRIAVKKYSTLRMCKDLMQLPLSHSPSLLSAGAKSHVSAASGCVDSFTNRNVKHHTRGGSGR